MASASSTELQYGLGLRIEVGPGRPPRLVEENPKVNWGARLRAIKKRQDYLSEAQHEALSRARLQLTSRYRLLLTPGTERNKQALEEAEYADLLKFNNTKVEGTFGSTPHGVFTLPEVFACPGAGACKDICFAAVGRYNTDASALLKVRNWIATTLDTFVPNITREIRKGKLEVVRVHDAGDFFEDWYAHRWFDIAEANPRTLFYAYTKSAKIVKKVIGERGGRSPQNFRLIYSWGMEESQVPFVDLAGGDRMSLIICAPTPPSDPWTLVVKEQTQLMVAQLLESNTRYKLRSVGSAAPLFADGSHSEIPVARGDSQFVLLSWHGGGRGELYGIGNKPELVVPMTGQSWTGSSWTPPAKYSRRAK